MKNESTRIEINYESCVSMSSYFWTWQSINFRQLYIFSFFLKKFFIPNQEFHGYICISVVFFIIRRSLKD